jgi:hypothetical protein
VFGPAKLDMVQHWQGEPDGIQVLLAAINNHLGCASVYQNACWVMYNITRGSKENTDQLIILGGGAAVAKVGRKWRDNNDVQKQVRKLANLFEAEWNARADEEQERRRR